MKTRILRSTLVAMPDNITESTSEANVIQVQNNVWADRAFHFIAVGPR